LTGPLAGLRFLDFYREFGWGLPVHIYDWYEELYSGGVEKRVTTEGRHRIVTWRTPRGDLVRRYKLDAEGTWSEYGHMVKSLDNLDIVRFIVEHTKWQPKFKAMEQFLAETEGFGVADTVLFRSPFGKLVHEYMGFEAVTYALFDHEDEVLEFLHFQEHYDLEFAALAATAPLGIVIVSDHADENLISPAWYEAYCIPYYRKVCDLLHGAGKVVSTHLDGNFRGFFPIIGDAGFDLLDGCTPAPMFNYEVEELAGALKPGMSCYCGVPASMFTTNVPAEEIATFGERIARAFDGRVIVNVGDILPPTGDIDGVIELGKRIQSLTV
jgi:hypothetical protein